jgi:hypothetical protein
MAANGLNWPRCVVAVTIWAVDEATEDTLVLARGKPKPGFPRGTPARKS